MARSILCINDLSTSVFCINGSGKIGLQPFTSMLSITDGTTTQAIDGGDIITFAAGGGLDVTVSATDTVTYASQLSTDVGNDITFGTDGGLYISKNDLVSGASWNDTTNTLVLTFDSGATVNVPIVDSVASFLSDFTVAGNTGTDLVNNHDTLTVTGAANSGLTTAVTANTITIDFNCAEPLDVSGLPVCQ